MTEEWRDIPGWESYYSASSEGRIASKDRVIVDSRGIARKIPGRILRQKVSGTSRYRAVNLSRGGKPHDALVHILVLSAFSGPRPNGSQGCHNDGDALNNRASNLRWDTPSSNLLDQVFHGTHANARKTRCLHGHPLSGSNLYVYPGKAHRGCRTCRRERKRRARTP